MNIARAEDMDHGASHGKGNVLFALGVAVVSGIINDAQTSSALNKAKADAHSVNEFRTCFIDLDSGDIIY